MVVRGTVLVAADPGIRRTSPDGGEVVMPERVVAIAELHRQEPATAERLAPLRRALADWATRIGVARHVIEDLVLATYEAMANVVEHAYRNCAGGLLDLRARADRAHDTLTVTVTDHGQWRPPPLDRGRRGRGLSLIRNLAERAEVRSTCRGTTVTMTYPMT
jgi:serine/threonine-protein kinase RsbW